MEVVLAWLLFVVGAVLSGVQRAWVLLCLCAAFAVLYAERAFNQF
jgi:hypothetical protein